MLRRMLAIASFVLVLPVSAAAVFALVTFPEAVGISMRYPEALALSFARLLFPLSGVVASLCNGLHLYRGSVPGSLFRRLLHVSNAIFAVLVSLVAWLIYVITDGNYTVGYGVASGSFMAVAATLAILATPVLIVAIYLVLLFWRGAVADLPQR